MSSCGEKGGSLATVTFADVVQAGPWAFVQMSPEVWLVTLHFTPLCPSDQGDCLYLPFNAFALWQMSWPSAWFLSIGQKRTSEFLFHPTEANGGAECYDTDSLSASSCHAVPPFLFWGVHVGMDGRLRPAR